METKSIGENIKALRIEHDMTHEQLAEKLNIPLNVLIDWEIDYGGPNGDQMMQLVDIFNVTYNELAGRINKTVLSRGDIAIMASLTLMFLSMVQPILKGFNLFQIPNAFMNQDVSFMILLSAIGILVSTVFHVIGLFLFIQNPRRYQFYTKDGFKFSSLLLTGFTILALIGTVGKSSIGIYYVIFMICGLAQLPLYLLQATKEK